MKKILLYFIFIPILFIRCEIFSKKEPEPEKLPPATMEGKHTFGCYVNGEPWTPRGCKGFPCTSLQMIFDHSSEGRFTVVATKVYGGKDQIVSVSMDSLYRYGESTYSFQCVNTEPSTYRGGIATFGDFNNNCHYWCMEDATITSGFCTVSRFDLKAGIISGTFEFTLTLPECDDIVISDGRFDMQL